jgi:hypothetical protein
LSIIQLSGFFLTHSLTNSHSPLPMKIVYRNAASIPLLSFISFVSHYSLNWWIEFLTLSSISHIYHHSLSIIYFLHLKKDNNEHIKNVIINSQPDARTVAPDMDSVRLRMESIGVTVLRAGPDPIAQYHLRWCAMMESIMMKVCNYWNFFFTGVWVKGTEGGSWNLNIFLFSLQWNFFIIKIYFSCLTKGYFVVFW